ncbi:hypothetical protein PG996_011553 [Apiospora saccharicola]|uniref:Uncharacterized protein n=1 Tax=Apiospora saccharicola TaxID=335842 RepID=A0ABR1UFE2_9PEZI
METLASYSAPLMPISTPSRASPALAWAWQLRRRRPNAQRLVSTTRTSCLPSLSRSKRCKLGADHDQSDAAPVVDSGDEERLYQPAARRQPED